MATKQVIIMRKDLRDINDNKIHTGKLIAQGAHASMKVFFDKMRQDHLTTSTAFASKTIDFTEEELEWVDGIFTKVCLAVNSEKELLDIYSQAKEAKLNCSLIQDAGLTEFGGVKTYTCCAIGPNNSDAIDKITSNLSLF